MSYGLLGLILVGLVSGCASSRGTPSVGGTGGAGRGAAPGRAERPAPAALLAPIDEATDRVVAVVNNDAVTLGELQEAIAAFRQENPKPGTPSDEELARQFLQRLIETRLQLQEADREKVVVEASEVEDELGQRLKRLGASSGADTEAMLKAQGLTMEAVRKRVRDSLRIARIVRRKVTLRISVTDQEIDGYVTEHREKLDTGLGYHARHILVTPAGDSDAAWEGARIRAGMIRAQLVDGADFAELARLHSQDASAKAGGDLGRLKRGELAPDVEAEILGLEVGEVSPPYRSRLGYHLFRLEGRDRLAGEAMQRVRQQVRDILFRQKFEARLEAWLEEMKERSIVEVRM
jgi:peptidyl-prolyl cis-trans isomerase SurA